MEEQSTGIIQRKLLETASELLVRILGRLTTSFKADDTGVLDTVGIGQLQAILEELNAVWESVQDPDIRYEIATSASNVEAVLETVCDFIFRTTRLYGEPLFEHFRECIVMLSQNLTKWTQYSPLVQQKLLTKGLLFVEIRAVELLISSLANEDARQLVAFHLITIHKCFICNDFRLMYQYSDTDWSRILKDLIDFPNFCLKILSKSLACLMHLALGQERENIMVLEETEARILCEALNADALFTLPDFCVPFMAAEIILLIKSLCSYPPNMLILLSQSTLLSSALKILNSNSQEIVLDRTKWILLLLMKLIQYPTFESTKTQSFIEPVSKYASMCDFPLRNVCAVLLCHCKSEKADIAIQDFFCESAEVLEGICDRESESFEVIHDFLNVSADLLLIACEGHRILMESNIMAMLFKVAAYIFKGSLLKGSIPFCLPMIMFSILQWCSRYKVLSPYIIEHSDMLAVCTYQLQVIGKSPLTTFNRFLVKLNLAILLSCVNEEDHCMRFADENWLSTLFPWLKSKEKDISIAAFIVTNCLSHHLYDENPSIFNLTEENKEVYLTYFTKACEVPHLRVSILNGLVSISASHFVFSLKLQIVNLHTTFKTEAIFNEIANLLVNGGLPEIKAACSYICALREFNDDAFDSLMKKCPLPMVEILEQLQDIEDSNTKMFSERALQTINTSFNEKSEFEKKFDAAVISIKELIESAGLNFALYNEKCNQLSSLLMEIHAAFPIEQQRNIDYIANTPSIPVIIKYCSKLLEHMISESMDKEFIQCLVILLSCFASWSDKSERIRYKMINTEMLIHVANVVSFFVDLSNDSEPVLKGMVLNACTILSNCAQEHNFSLLYTAPGTVDWANLLQHWMLSTFDSLRFSAKALAGYFKRNLNEDQFFLLDLTDDEINRMIQMLKEAVNSSSLVGSGFGCRYSATELLIMLDNFILSKENYDKIVTTSSSDIINFLTSLITNAGNTARKYACRALLKLLNNVKFKTKANYLGMENTLSSNIGEDDPSLSFLCQCIQLSLKQEYCCSTGTLPHYIVHFDALLSSNITASFRRLLTFLTSNLSPIIKRFQNRSLNISTRRYPKSFLLLEVITEIHNFWDLCSPGTKDLLLKELCQQSQILDVLHALLMKVYSVLCTSEEVCSNAQEKLGPYFTQLSLCFLSWAHFSKDICVLFIEKKFLIDYLRILKGSRLTRDTKFERLVVTIFMSILLECVQVPKIKVYFNSINWSESTSRWALCTHQELRLLTKFAIGFLTSAAETEDLSILVFEPSDTLSVVDLLHEAVTPKQLSRTFYFNISILTLLNSLNQLLLLTLNHSRLREILKDLIAIFQDDLMIDILFQLIENGSTEEKMESCKLLWTLSNLFSHPTCVSERLHAMIKCPITQSEVGRSCQCVLYSMDESELKDFNSLELYANFCFIQDAPNLCIKICDEVATRDFDCSIDSIKLLKGKSYYKQYIREKRMFDIRSLSEDMKKKQLNVCFQPNILAIKLLGESLDEGFIDDEGTYMLDRAMMDCIFKANMLDHCDRCYLCRKKLQGNEKLIKSHVIPHSILNMISPEKTGNKQSIYSLGSSIKKADSRLLAPGEIVYYMLCRKCENIVSIYGETQFSPHFFQKIYPVKNQNDSLVKEQLLDYGPWLYQFCLTLIYRALRWDINQYLNDDDIYATFKQCRSCINSWSNGQEEILDFPIVYIFVAPLCVEDHEQMQHKYLNWYLRSSISSKFGGLSSEKIVLMPSFFVIQMGLVSVLVSFGKAFEQKFDRFKVKPSGGSFWVPCQLKRKENIPSELWDVYVNGSELLQEHVGGADPVLSVHTKTETGGSLSHTIIGSGIATAGISTVTENLANLRVKKDHSFLPPQFLITSVPKQMKLPNGHKILLHSNYVRGHKSGSTFFIAVGSGKKYPISRPYVIWHFYEPTGTITSGAFFSKDSLEITDFLMSNKTTAYKAFSDTSFFTARERMPTILKDLLQEKGFSSIISLMHRVQTAHATKRSLPPFDTKCNKDRKCWYCKFLCQNCCLNHAAYGRMSPGPHGLNIFCSEPCQMLSPGFLKDPPHVFIISPSEPPPSGINIHCSPLSKSHQEVVHLYIRLLNKKNFPCEIEFAIYIGDGCGSFPSNKPYAVFYSHHLCHQLFVEFFISSVLLAEEPLPQIANESSWNAILKLNEANILQKCLEKGDLLEIVLLQLSQLLVN